MGTLFSFMHALDAMIQRMDGYALAETPRRYRNNVPISMVTARDAP